MSDEIENKDVDDKVPESRRPLAGERLAEARRKQQITVLEVAKELHLDEPKVRALEQNKFEALGAPVFAKGHLKKYAKLVGVSIDDLLGDYYELNRTSGMPPVVGKVRKQAREITPGPWVAAIVVVVVVAIAYWFFVVRDASSPPASQGAVDTQAEELEPAPPPQEQNTDSSDPDGSIVDEPISSQSVAEPEAEPPSPPVAEAAQEIVPPIAAGDVRLNIRFSGDCWTEITDASGRRLFFDLGRNGRTVNVSGRGPLSVLFGNAEFVNLSVNGEAYEIGAADRRGRTARFSIYVP